MQEIKLFNTEEFKIEKAGEGKSQKVILKGNAMPLNETSRNGVYYRPESVKKAYKSLEGVPFLFAHQQNEVRHVLGKVEKVDLTNSHVTYEADIDSEEKEFIRKSEKGYIKHVSVGCLIDPNTVEFDEEKQIANVDVIEFCELSSAPVPGFKNTNAQLGKQNLVLLAESLGKEDMIKKLKETEEPKEPEEEKPEETPSNPDEDESSATSTDGEATQPKETEEGDKDKDEEDTPEDKEIEEEPKEEPKEETIQTEENENEEGEEPEKTTEEQVTELNSKLNEMEGKLGEVVNQVAVLESKIDTLLDEAEDDDEEDEDDDEDDEEETKETEELKPLEEEFKTKEEPVQEIKAKEKALKIDPKSTEVNIESQIKKNRRY
jgi:hypothetical protein